MRSLVAAIGVLFHGATLAAEDGATLGDNPVDFSDLPAEQPFQVQFRGEAREAPLGDEVCVWLEHVAGVKEGQTWKTHRVLEVQRDPVRAHSAHGVFTLNVKQMRAHLAPSKSRIWLTDEHAPSGVQAWMSDREGPATEDLYCLEPGRTYHAKVEVETYMLPPASPEGAPQQGENRVLLVSDAPFVDGTPPRPRTPWYAGMRY